MTAAHHAAPERFAPKARLAAWARPALGLLLPTALAVAWEVAVRTGLSNGRLVPPPSVIWQTFSDLAATGELQRHALATLWRVACGFVFGVAAGTLAGAITTGELQRHALATLWRVACGFVFGVAAGTLAGAIT